MSDNGILLIDDNRDSCEMMAVLLGLKGFKSHCAFSYREGLERAKQGGFQLMILDWHFEDGIGLELCREVRRFDPVTPILFCSGEVRREFTQMVYEVGAQGYLVKPIYPEELLAKVHRYNTKALSFSG